MIIDGKYYTLYCRKKANQKATIRATLCGAPANFERNITLYNCRARILRARRTYIYNFAAENHSVRRAITGSFLAAADAGMRPDMSVSTTLMTTIITA